MSHGLVNNVARSHSTPDTNVCNQFIPQVVSHPIIRKKCVLQILDGIKGYSKRGPSVAILSLPGSTTPSCLRPTRWPSTTSNGGSSTRAGSRKNFRPSPRPASRASTRLAPKGFDIRQPQHIALAGNLGLGRFEFDSPQGRRRSIDHRVIDLG